MNTDLVVRDRLANTRRFSADGWNQKHVYIVDDDVAAGEALSFCLRTLGYDAHLYRDGPQFLSDLDTREPGCILLDLAIPQMTGFDIIEIIGDRLDVLPAIVITGRGDVASAVKAMKMGAADFIEKPYEESLLIEAMERVFASLQHHLTSSHAVYDATRRLARLTLSEKQLLQEIAAGVREPLIAHRLNLSGEELRLQIAATIAKLDVLSLPEALRIVYLGGLNANCSVAFAA